jgi:tetratricopeptide (TPR) repeat protein
VKRNRETASKAGGKKRSSWWLLGAVLLVIFLAYSNSFGVGFFLDNEEIILKDPRVHSVSSLQLHRILTQQYWETATTGLYRPLTTLSYLFNYAILGSDANPEGYHWINLLLHVGNTTLVYLLGLVIFTEAPMALLLSALWGLHPVNTEVVTNIVGRADLLVTFGVLAALLCHRQALSASGRRKIAWVFAILIAVTVGVFAKESGLVAVGVIAAYDLTVGRGGASWRARIPSYVAAIAPCAVYLYARAQVLANAPVLATNYCDNPLLGADFWTARLTAIKVIGRYFALLVWPANLSWDYSYNEIPLESAPSLATILTLIGCLGAAVLAIWCWRRYPAVSFGIVFAAVTFSPVSNQLIVIGTIMGERFLYLPSIGLIACAVFGLFVLRNRRAVGFASAVILLALAARTYARNSDWLDQHRFWRTGVEAAPGSYKTHLTVATTASFVTVDDWERAVQETDRTLAILNPLPDSENVGRAYRLGAMIYREVGEQLAAKKPVGRFAAGTTPEQWYRKALAAALRSEEIEQVFDENYRQENARHGRPGLSSMPSPLYLELGRIYLRLGEQGNALAAFERGLALEASPELLEEAAAIYQQVGEPKRAAIALEESYTVDSNRPVLGKLVDLYRQIDPGGCSVSREGNDSALNPECPLVHADICQASRNIAGTYVRRGQPFEADAVRKRAIEYLGCAPELVN